MLCGIWTDCKSFLLAPRHRANGVRLFTGARMTPGSPEFETNEGHALNRQVEESPATSLELNRSYLHHLTNK